MTQALAACNLLDSNSQLHQFRKGDVLPDWALARITNPSIIGTGTVAAEVAVETFSQEVAAVVAATPASTPESVAAPELAPLTEKQDYSQMKRDDLKLLCEERGLTVRGTVAELIERLEAHDAEKAKESAEVDEADLWEMNEAELLAHAKARNIDVSGATSTSEILAIITNAEG